MPIFNTVYGGEPKWKPGDNTLVYYDFKDDTTSLVNNKGTLGSTLNATPTGITYSSLSSGKKVANYSSNTGGIKSNGTLNMPSNFTVIYWIKGSSTGRQGGFGFYGTGENDFWFNADNYKFNLYSYNTSWVFAAHNNSIDVLDGNWHTVCWTWDGTINKVYVDNNEVSLSFTNGNAYNNPIQNNSYVIVGQNRITGQSWSFLGQCGEFVVEDKAWTTDDITNYYNLTKSNYGL